MDGRREGEMKDGHEWREKEQERERERGGGLRESERRRG